MVMSYIDRLKNAKKFCEENNLLLQEDAEITPGDFYIAERNTGVKLLECKSVDPRGWINPVGIEYPYDIFECIKVTFKK